MVRNYAFEHKFWNPLSRRSLDSLKPKNLQQTVKVQLYVLNNFIRKRVTAKSSKCSLALVSGQTSRPYKRIDGDTFCGNEVQDNFLGCDSSNFTTYSISWSIKAFLVLLNEHLNFTERVMYMPRYLMVSTQGIMSPEAVVILLHSILRRGPILKQQDFLELVIAYPARLYSCSSSSQMFTKCCSSLTDGAIIKMSSAYSTDNVV